MAVGAAWSAVHHRKPAGAGTNIGTEAVVRAPADGYTLLMVTTTHATNAALYDKLNFDLIHDITPIAGVFRGTIVMVVHPSVPAKSLPEFIAYVKANPGKINMGSAGIGSVGHLAGELFKMMASIDMTHVPYRGGGQVMTDLLGWAGAGLLRRHTFGDPIPQSREAARAGGDHGDAFRGTPRHPDLKRLPARL